MVRIQRRIGNRGGIVAEGRDTGSTVFPFAHVKIFLTADMGARIDRRVEQLRQMGITQSGDEIRDNLVRRDEIDSGTRAQPSCASRRCLRRRYIGRHYRGTGDDHRGDRQERSRAGWRPFTCPGEKEIRSSRGHRFLFTISRNLIRFLESLLFGIRVHGSENLRFAESFFFASNHISYYDPPDCRIDTSKENSG